MSPTCTPTTLNKGSYVQRNQYSTYSKNTQNENCIIYGTVPGNVRLLVQVGSRYSIMVRNGNDWRPPVYRAGKAVWLVRRLVLTIAIILNFGRTKIIIHRQSRTTYSTDSYTYECTVGPKCYSIYT